MECWQGRTVLLLVIVAKLISTGSTEAQVRTAEKLRVVYSAIGSSQSPLMDCE